MTALYRPPIHTQADLEGAWRHLMGPGGFAGPSLWMMVILGDDHPLPHLVEMTDADEPPGPAERAALADFLRHFAAETGDGLRFAFLRSRPGGHTVTPLDRAWAEALYDVARTAGIGCEVVHLATRDRIRPVPPDELTVLATA